MKQRVLSGVLICAVLAVFIGFSGFPVVLKAVTAAISACALYEVLVVTKYVESKTLMVISLLFAIAIPFFPDFQRAGFTGGIFIFAVILFTSLICLYKTFSFEHLCVVFVMSIIIPFFFSCIIYTRQISDTLGLYYMLMIFLCAWATDTGGYIFGRLFGRHRMTPVISPKKTIEGAVVSHCSLCGAPIHRSQRQLCLPVCICLVRQFRRYFRRSDGFRYQTQFWGQRLRQPHSRPRRDHGPVRQCVVRGADPLFVLSYYGSNSAKIWFFFYDFLALILSAAGILLICMNMTVSRSQTGFSSF